MKAVQLHQLKSPIPVAAGGRAAKAPGAPAWPALRAVRGRFPAWQLPQLCTPVREAPASPGWISEVKLDGCRILAWKAGARVRLTAQDGRDCTDRHPGVAALIGTIDVKSAVVDACLVAPRDDDLADPQHARGEEVHVHAFDLLALDGWDLRPCVLLDRKRLLEGLHGWSGRLHYSAHVDDDANLLFAAAVRSGGRGIVCKRNAPYRAGRGPDWVKLTVQGRVELAVLGWSPPDAAPDGVATLRLGWRDDAGRERHVGTIGLGALEAHAIAAQLASQPPADGGDHVAEVAYSGWSAGRVVHPVLLGLRRAGPASLAEG